MRDKKRGGGRSEKQIGEKKRNDWCDSRVKSKKDLITYVEC